MKLLSPKPSPLQVALEYFAPRVVKGGIIVFDELNEEAFPGETLAVIEYFGGLNNNSPFFVISQSASIFKSSVMNYILLFQTLEKI